MIRTTAPAESDTKALPAAGWVLRTARHPQTRQVGRIAFRSYITLLLLGLTVHVVALFLQMWRPDYAWGALADRFVTSPAMAGLFAVFAAFIGAWSLNMQLRHTKQKAEDEAWWEQFEWVTDRIVSPDNEPSAISFGVASAEKEKAKKTKDPLPRSLAYNLMTALSKKSREGFQKTAVAGIFDHYFRGMPSPDQDGTETSIEPRMDATEAESLRALLAELPPEATSSVGAHQLLSAYDRYHHYEEEVQNALRHRFGSAHSEPSTFDFGADAVVEFGSHKLVVEVKQSVLGRSLLENTSARLRAVVASQKAAGAVIITTPPSLKSSDSKLAKERIRALGGEGIHLIEWSPAEGSGALRDKIFAILPEAVIKASPLVETVALDSLRPSKTLVLVLSSVIGVLGVLGVLLAMLFR